MSPTDRILQRIQRTISRRSMASTLGDPFPLPGTGGAAMARLELSSSGVRHRKAAESSGASPGWSSLGHRVEERWEQPDGVTGDAGLRGDLRLQHLPGCCNTGQRPPVQTGHYGKPSPKDGADLGEGWWSPTPGIDRAGLHGCLELMLVAAPGQTDIGQESPEPP